MATLSGGRPRGSRRPGRASWIAVAAVGLAVAAVAAPVPTAGVQPPSFEPGTLTSSFPMPVRWIFSFTSAATPLRIELLRRFPGTDATLVSDPKPEEVTHRADRSWLVAGTDDQPVTPNTPYRMRLRVTTADGVYLGREARILVQDLRFDWHVLSSSRLRLHWYSGGGDFASRALQIGESGLTRAEDFLGVHFDSPVDIFIYADQAPFRDAIGPLSPENAAGVPFSGISTFFALIPPEQINSSFVADVVPHELTHLVLQSAIGPDISVPLWFNEGMAVYLSTGDNFGYRAQVSQAVQEKTILPLAALHGDFPTDPQGNRESIGYAEGVSAVDYMVRRYGQAKVAALVHALGSMGIDAAFRSVFGVDTAAFGDSWLRSVGASTPKQYGPQPARSGPLPSDWLGAAPTAGLIGATAGASASAPGATSSTAPSASPARAPALGSGPAAIVIALAVALLVLGVLGAWLARRGRKREVP